MQEIKNIEIFKAGEVSDSLGYSDTYTITDLQEIVNTYNKEVHEAPIIWGHDSDKNWAKLVTSRTQLANGWVTALKVIDDTLMADIEVDKVTYDAIKSGKLKKRSIGLYPKNSKHNPTTGQFHLRHLALLGTEPPAIKGLQDIKIYNEAEINSMDDTIQLLDEKASEWLAFALIDEGNGFNGEIVSFIPTPAEDNNWLFDADKEEYKGKFEDDAGQIFDFTIVKEEENWITSIRMNLDKDAEKEVNEVTEEETTEEEVTEKEVNEVTEEETIEATEEETTEEETTEEEVTEKEVTEEEVTGKEVTEKEVTEKEVTEEEVTEEEVTEEEVTILKMTEQINSMAAKLKEYEDKEKANLESETKAFCEEMYSQGYLTEAQIKHEALYKIISALTEIAGTVTYSEGSEEVLVVKGIKDLLKSFPKKLIFSDATVARGGEIAFVSPYKNGTEESNREYSLIRKYMEKNNISDFGIGYREYRLNK